MRRSLVVHAENGLSMGVIVQSAPSSLMVRVSEVDEGMSTHVAAGTGDGAARNNRCRRICDEEEMKVSARSSTSAIVLRMGLLVLFAQNEVKLGISISSSRCDPLGSRTGDD